MQRTPSRPALLALASLLLAGCIDDSLSPPASAGVYLLEARNGAPMPVLLADGAAGRTALHGGVLRLEADRSFSIRYDEGVSTGAVTTYHMTIVVGTYAERGASVTLTPWGGDAMAATRSGGTITVADRETSLEFRR
jgi:hypothetical protein